jgi:hypothetical protein
MKLRHCAVAALMLAVTALAADPPSRVPVEPFFKHADYGQFKLSPSGSMDALRSSQSTSPRASQRRRSRST